MNRGGIRFSFITHLYEKAYNLLCRYSAGCLTQTWVSDILDLPNMLDYDIRNGRTYMYAKAKPIYPFGFGLSYTTFKYSKMKVKKDGDNYVVSFNLKNTGTRDGEEVVQLYAKFRKDSSAKLMLGASSADIRLKKRVRL